MKRTVTVPMYIQIEPTSRYYDGQVSKAKASRVGGKRPSSPLRGSLMVKIELEIPSSAFDPLMPSAVVTIPENLTEATIHVEAMSPGEDED